MTAPLPIGDPEGVETYLASQPQPQQGTLRALRAMLRSILPEATEALRYGMPAFVAPGGAIAGYAGAKAHCGYYPMSGTVLGQAGDAVAGYATSKGALRFPIDQPPPLALVRHLVDLRLAELDADPGR